jgi:hypothetical protein
MNTIDFSRTTNFTGRNGYFQMKGVRVFKTSRNNVMIVPITKRGGNEARCDIEVPMENLEAFIEELKKLKNAS